MFPGGRHVSGREEIRQNEIEFYETPGFREWRGTVESIRFVSDDVAIVEHAGSLTLDTGKRADHATVVVVRRDEAELAALKAGSSQPQSAIESGDIAQPVPEDERQKEEGQA